MDLNEVNCNSDDEDLPEPVIDCDDEIRVTGQIQSTLASTVESKEFVVETWRINGEYKMAEKIDAVEKLFVGQEWLNYEQCTDYLKNLTRDMN